MKLKYRLWLLVCVLLFDCLLGAVFLYLWKNDPGAYRATAKVSEMSQDVERVIALTFDDGPHREFTEKLLDGLKERNVVASFFLVGKNIVGNEDLVRRMSQEGHLIGTHCLEHTDLTKMPIDEACDEIRQANQMIVEITGKEPEYIRPPYGAWSGALDDSIGMTAVYWDIDPLDWKSQNRGKTVRHILKQVEKHNVILLHDVFSPSVEAALEVIDTLKKQGYTFVTIDEMLID